MKRKLVVFFAAALVAPMLLGLLGGCGDVNVAGDAGKSEPPATAVEEKAAAPVVKDPEPKMVQTAPPPAPAAEEEEEDDEDKFGC